MGRPTRTFKLKVSRAGFDLLVDCHIRLVRETRTLIPYGTTLHVAVDHLREAVQHGVISDRPRLGGLAGATILFVGAPRTLGEHATAIARKLGGGAPSGPTLEIGHVYLLALDTLLHASSQDMLASFARVVRGDASPPG
jgi:hypothetical protein